MTARQFKFRFSASYGLLMVGAGIQLPFLPLWLSSKGFSASQIASVVAAMMAVRVIGAPLFASLADYSRRRIVVIRACAFLALACYAALAVMPDYWSVLVVGMLAAMFFAPVFPLVEGFSVDSSAALGIDYGRLRLWASISFLTGSLSSGALLTAIPAGQTMALIAAAQALTVLATLILPPEPSDKSGHHASTPDLGDALRFLFASRFTVFLFAASLANASHGMLFSFSSLQWAQLGFSTFDIGALWACAVIAEVMLFFFSNKIVEDVGVARLLCIGLFGAVMRWLGMGLASNIFVFAALQALHCISFAASHLALMHFIRINVGPHLRNTAQGLYAAFAGGVLLSSVTLASGPLYAQFGPHAYFFMAGIAALGLAIAIYSLVKLIPTGRLAAAASSR